jgi:branched-chain amino acid transport system permease protein
LFARDPSAPGGTSAKVWGAPPELAISRGHGGSGRLASSRVPSRSAVRGSYFAMITLALAQMIYFFSCKRLSHGEDGIQAGRAQAVQLFDLNNTLTLYYVVLDLPRRVSVDFSRSTRRSATC